MKIARLGVLVGVVLLLSTPTFATEILLYDNNTINQNAQTALDNLGLTYTIATSGTFDGLLTGSSWDLVVMDVPSTVPSDGFDALVDYVDDGGSAIMSFWRLQTEPGLEGAFEAESVTSFNTPQEVYSWDLGHPIWDGVGTLTAWNSSWGDNGDELALPVSGVALGGFAPGAGTLDMAAIIHSGNTIYNGFLFDNITDANGVQLIENEVSFLLDVPEPGTALLLGLGLVGIAVRRMRG